ncbi:MAG: hypothetical protein KF891_13235 [Rhizobacter sp.]|nr:hypothetical protein [Rhizobacter sp.]
MERYHVELRESDGILIVETSGDRDPVEAEFLVRERELWSQMARTCRALSLRRVLYVSGLTGRASTTVTHTIVSELDALGWCPSLQIALVREDQHAERVVAFGVRLAAERGYWAQVFNTRDAALQWLRQPSPARAGC